MNFKDKAGERPIFTIRADGTVDVPGVEFLDELSRVFWVAVGESNPLKARVAELEGALREAAQYDSDEGPCFGMAPCCIADYGPGSRERCRRIRDALSPTTRKEDE